MTWLMWRTSIDWWELIKIMCTMPMKIIVIDINRLVGIVHILVTFENGDFQVSELPNVVLDHLVDIEGWTHTDYIGQLKVTIMAVMVVLKMNSH